MQRKLLSVKDLNINFDTLKAVQGISFDLYKGETIGIVGESGSGKSVSALSILRLLSENPKNRVSGQILYHGPAEEVVDLMTISASELEQIRGNKISMVFQEPLTSLNPTMPCGEQILEVLQCHKKLSASVAKKTVLSLLEKVKIKDPERAYRSFPHELSGGQKQRIMIGMAICCQPELLIADEPTTSLDVTIQKSILEQLKQFKDEGSMSFIFISHDLGLIGEVADRVLVMKEGQIVEHGTTGEIFSNPKHPYTKGLLACLPPLDVKLSKLPVLADFTTTIGAEYSNFDYRTILDSYELSAAEIENQKQTIIQSKVLLNVENLCTWFPLAKDIKGKTVDYVKAVDGVSFDVRVGETIGLVGESGCGKTTLSRTLMRLIPSTAGKMYFKNALINDLEGKELLNYRKEVQLIFQDPYSSLNPRMCVGNAIIEPMQFHKLLSNEKERREKVDYLMQVVGLDSNHFYRFPYELSGGQRQRIVIARALAVEPSLLICDECVSALDVSVQAQVLNLLMDLRKLFKLSCIFISHDLAVVKHMSERMMVMNNGKIEETGFATDIYMNPQSDYTGRLIESIPRRNIF